MDGTTSRHIYYRLAGTAHPHSYSFSEYKILADANRSISDDPGSNVFRDVGWERSTILRSGPHAGSMELSAVGNTDLGSFTEQKKAKIRARDVKTIAQIMEPIVGKNAKAEAKNLLSKFNSINELFQYFANNDARALDLSQPVVKYLKIISNSFTYALEREILSGPVLPSSSALYDYLFNSYSASESEIFRVLFLDAANRLIEDRLMGIGTVNRVQVYARQVVKAALDLNATGIILVHNHPSGDPKPSPSDVFLTEKIVAACETFELEMIDHLIVARSGISSLRELNLLRVKAPSEQSIENMKQKPTKLLEVCLQSMLEIIRKS